MSRRNDPGLARKLLLLSRVLAVSTLGTLVALFGSAGVLVQEDTGLNVHGTAAVALHILAGLLALTLALRAWATGKGLWAAVTSAIAFVLTFGQAQLGDNTTLAFHIGGSLVIAVLFTLLTAWSFRAERSPAEAPSTPGTPGLHRPDTRRST